MATTDPKHRRTARIAKLKHLLAERVVVFDGGYGTMIQQHRLSEAEYRGTRLPTGRATSRATTISSA